MEKLPEGHPEVKEGLKCPYQSSTEKSTKKCPMDQEEDENVYTTEDFLCEHCRTYLTGATVLIPCKHTFCSYCATEINSCPKYSLFFFNFFQDVKKKSKILKRINSNNI
jgi:hypothetical protein